jgi:hypothetical protein
MSIQLNKNEFKNLLKYWYRNPLFFFIIFYEFLILIYKGIKLRFTYLIKFDKHSIGKKRPKDILSNFPNYNFLSNNSNLFFPKYSNLQIDFIFKKKAVNYDENDIEFFYLANRFTNCIEAIFQNKNVADLALSDSLNWINKKIPKTDIAWEAYSSSERVANMVILISKCNIEIDDQYKKIIHNFLNDSIIWIDNHLEFYCARRTNNHILNNCRALILAGFVVDNKNAVERGLLLFNKMAKSLFLENGFLRERSSHYQIITTNWLLDSIYFAERYAKLSADSLKSLNDLKYLSNKVINASKYIIDSFKTNTTQIGDVSPDYSPIIAIQRLKLLYIGSYEFPIEGLKYIDNWLFINFNNQTLIANIPSSKYPIYYPTHGHNDLGSFIWYNHNIPVIVDAGRYRYTLDDLSNLQITGEGHNTILINNLPPLSDSLNIGGSWYPNKYADAEISFSYMNSNEFSISHTGFNRLQGITLHKRNVQIKDSTIYIEDNIEGCGNFNIKLNWHLSELFSQDSENPNNFLFDKYILQWNSFESKNRIPILSTLSYFISPEYSIKQKSLKIEASYNCSLPTKIITSFKLI